MALVLKASFSRQGYIEGVFRHYRRVYKILQPPNVVKFIFLYNSRYLIYLNNKNHKVHITDFEFISNVFIVLDGQDRY